MIKSITLTNWKSFGEKATLFVDPLTVVIGTNASGKSNLLDALVFLREFVNGRRLDEAFAGTGNGYVGIRGGETLVIRKGAKSAKIAVEVLREPSGVFEYHVEVYHAENFGGLLVDETLYEVLEEVRTELCTFKKMEHCFTQMDVERWVSEAIKDERKQSKIIAAEKQLREDLGAILVIDPIPQNMRAYSKLSRVIQPDTSNIAGFLANREDQRTVETKLSTALRELPENEIVKIWAEAVEPLKKDAMLFCKEKWPGEKEELLMDADGISDGTLRLIAILTTILTADKGSTIVIEEVDNGLHPSRADLLVKLLREFGADRGVDIICTTHDPALLDAFGNEMVRFISIIYRDPKTGTSDIKLLSEIEHFPRLMARGRVGTLITNGMLEKAVRK